MKDATWILTKLGGKTGIPVICSNQHPDYEPEPYDVQIGQACFEANFNNGKLVNIAENVSLAVGHYIFAFAETLAEEGISLG